MITIETPTLSDVAKLTDLARTTFLQSHSHSASITDIAAYVDKHFTESIFEKEITDLQNHYRLLYQNNQLVGYSKIIFNQELKWVNDLNICKLERIYLLEETLGSGLGKQLFDYNLELTKKAEQAGIWLNVWVGNQRAIKFYEKMGFKNVGSFDFKISENHYNPNHQLYLKF